MFKFKSLLLIVFVLAQSFAVFSQITDSTENWKQYSSSMAGFAIKYPADWRIRDEEAKGQIWRVAFASPGVRDEDVTIRSSITICSKPKNVSFSVQSYCREPDDHLSVNYKNRIVSEKTYDLNGIVIRRKETEPRYAPNASFIYAFFSTKDREFLITSIFEKSFNLERYLPVFDQMLATFRSLEEKSVSTFKSEKYNFAITYPTFWKDCRLESQHTKENTILLIVPQEKSCSGANFISVSRRPEFSGKQLTGYALQELLKKNGFEKFNPFLKNLSAAQGERFDKDYTYRQSLFFTHFLTEYNLVEVSEQIENDQDEFQKQAKEILATTQRDFKSN